MNYTELIQLIKEEKTCNEICTILGISNRQLYNSLVDLERQSLFYKREYYSDGSIVYKFISDDDALLDFVKDFCNGTNIITPRGSDNLKCMVISDLHFGNSAQRLDLLDKVFDYCIKSNIHIIFCCGDMIDGSFSKTKQNIKSPSDQIEYFINNYPFDKSILTFAVAGNHDKCSYGLLSQDIISKVKNYRHDIIIGVYGNVHVNIKKDRILLHHHIRGTNIDINEATIILKGHYHKYSAGIKDNSILYIKVPSLSELNKTLPAVLELNLDFQNGKIEHVNVKQFIFINRLRFLSEEEFSLNRNFNTSSNIDNLSTSSDDKILVKRMSQIEKFNRRFGLK